jgi:hypothetical protein
MVLTTSKRTRGLVVGAFIAALLVVADIVSAAAAPPPGSSSGLTGHVNFRESPMVPAPICVYTEPEGGLSTVSHFRIRAPRVFWADDAPGTSGRVGWRVRVQESIDPASDGWYSVYLTGVQTGIAHDDAPARLRDRTVSHGGRLSEVWYRLMVQVYWYDTDGKVIGWVKHWYRWYGRTVFIGVQPDWSAPPDDVASGKCRNRWFM